MIKPSHVMPLRGLQAAVSMVILGFTAYVANWWSKYWRDMSPAEINFLLFSSVWTLLSLAYIVTTSLSRFQYSAFANKFAVLGVEALTMTFWFGGFVALAVFLSARVCFGNVCNVAKAGTAFAALQWLLFAATTSFTALQAFRGTRARIEKNMDMEGSPNA
ncbi:hypothetical protein BT63DRAFT_452156 [Microthyrium microscopicum]|uniref:MARVEL domain-containing protein n=1 Tax=Microthyrium microscopicum TaxID=703497 RepID=A0A6A6UHJ1_9PEZI|nr:hypothetical protein BT63DRAFT_452156 [Microthyrium microscopicum]